MRIKGMVVAVAMALGPAVSHADTPAKVNCPQDCPASCPHMGGGPMRGGPGGSGMRGGGWNSGPYARVYDPKTVETLKGEVVHVDHVAPMSGMSEGVHVVLKTDKGTTTDVHLGPAWYLDNQDTQVAVGDHIEVRGSRVNVGGKPAVVASEVKKGNDTLELRDAQGLPMWRGWR